MSELSALRQLQPLEKPMPSMPSGRVTKNGLAKWIRATIRHRDLIAVLGFCALGLILTFAAMAWLSDFPVVPADFIVGP